MKLLLDTHIWLWSALEPHKLGPGVEHELQQPDNELWLSPVSVWEATVLSRKGRLTIPGDRQVWFARAASTFREAVLTHEIAIATETVGLGHYDPADLFLAATAKVLGLTLVTADHKLLGLGQIATLANR